LHANHTPVGATKETLGENEVKTGVTSTLLARMDADVPMDGHHTALFPSA
jgi:hypothetical protein